MIPSEVKAFQLSEVQCIEERSRYLKLQLFFKALITQGSIIPLHFIGNEQYLGMNIIIGSLMKTKGLITNISFTFNHTMLLNPAYLMLFVDLTMSFIQARKLVVFYGAILANWWGMEFFKAISDRAERLPLVKCSRAETFLSVTNCAFLP